VYNENEITIFFFDFDNCGNGFINFVFGYFLQTIIFSESDKNEYE
jgi:hypothetical protein